MRCARRSALEDEVVLQVARDLEELGERNLVHDLGHRVRQHVLGVGEERHDVRFEREDWCNFCVARVV